MLHLNETGVEVLRKRISNKNTETYWNNYDFHIWRKNTGGYSDTNGVFRNSSWGISEKIAISSLGLWDFPVKYVKHFK